MKSANTVWKRTTISLLAFFVLTSCLFTSCGAPSFIPDEGENGDSSKDDIPVIAVPDVPPEPLFYNSYTGLVCDEEIATYRPLSICMGNFDGKQQNGLSFADVLIEAPVESGETRLWMVTTAWRSIPSLSSLASARSYMMPIAHSLGAIAVYAGRGDKTKAQDALYAGDAINTALPGGADAFWVDGEGIFTSGERLLARATAEGFALTGVPTSLPYALAPTDKPFAPGGNPITSIKIEYGVGKEALFTYQRTTSQYLAQRNGAAYGVGANGDSLTFSNVLILFHNVNYYHTDTDSYFTLDTQAGGSGYCYTGGGVLRISWEYEEGQGLVLRTESGEKLMLNRGRTYISMMKVTDAQKIIAK